MTRFDGYRLLACPLCHTIHATVNIVSFNFVAPEHWSDSYSVYSLFDNRQGLRQCTTCHDFFLQRDAPYIGHLDSEQASRLVATPLPYIPPFLRHEGGSQGSTSHTSSDMPNIRRSWIKRLKEWWSGEPHCQAPAEDTKDAKDMKAADEDQSKKYPRLKYASDEDLASILENQEKYSVNLIQAARILYWVHLNDSYRNIAKPLSEKGQLPYSAFKPTETQINNMRTLLALLEFADGGSREIAIAELHRELGQFDRAIDILQRVAKPCLKSETILEAAHQGISAPIPILYSYQKQN